MGATRWFFFVCVCGCGCVSAREKVRRLGRARGCAHASPERGRDRGGKKKQGPCVGREGQVVVFFSRPQVALARGAAREKVVGGLKARRVFLGGAIVRMRLCVCVLFFFHAVVGECRGSSRLEGGGKRRRLVPPSLSRPRPLLLLIPPRSRVRAARPRCVYCMCAPALSLFIPLC